jgi:hypothetical protein
LLIHYKNGASRSGLIVGLNGDVMRVALEGGEDLLEFKLVNETWLSEECEIVSFEFPPGIGRHENFRAEVAKAVNPMERLYGYLDSEAGIGMVN